MLKIAISSVPQVSVCLDALDECLPKHLPQLLECLRDIALGCPRTRIFFTGRPHVKEDIQRYFSRAILLPIRPNTDDITSYVEMRLARDAEPEAMNENLLADIIRTISEQISDIFLLVSICTDTILGRVTIHQRRRKLEEMAKGNGLSGAC
ncbi:unnamed protein product [Tuber aestivum]|uniref:NACHT domain-containing protein n=1 Tax=Tuber aestivum TaxID=59557 RepID=A0A292PXK8_9PEZI|nr:unnamed protein product [Tuber aestivum]